MPVYIGHASIDERGKATGGQAGDQTGKEVCIRTWYNAGWNVLLKPRYKAEARTMVSFVKAVCKGGMVGYDQWQRNTLRDVARAAHWDGSRLATKCETDCSAFMTVAAEAAGIDMAGVYTQLSGGALNAPVTQTMRRAFCATGHFVAHTEDLYLKSPDYLEAGDILVRESGHTAMVLTDGPKAVYPTFTAEPVIESYENVKLYEVVTKSDPLNCRDVAGSGVIVGTFSRGEVLTADSELYLSGERWVHVTGGKITGWCSGQYLKEVVQAPVPVPESEEDMDISTITEGQAATLVDLSQKYYAKLPESEWALGELDDAVELGITDGTRPRAFATREEVAIMVKRAARAIKEGAI